MYLECLGLVEATDDTSLQSLIAEAQVKPE